MANFSSTKRVAFPRIMLSRPSGIDFCALCTLYLLRCLFFLFSSSDYFAAFQGLGNTRACMERILSSLKVVWIDELMDEAWKYSLLGGDAIMAGMV